jgi:WXXGXW repeat (2 copies)
MNKTLYAGACAAALLGPVGSACVVEGGVAPPSGVAVSGPPPEPMGEVRPRPPLQERLVWVPGYWHWTGMQYAWIPGHWEAPPPGVRWRAPSYPLRDGVYYYEPGAWGSPR